MRIITMKCLIKRLPKWLLIIGLSFGLFFSLNANAPTLADDFGAAIPARSTPAADSSAKIALQFQPRVGEERVLRMHVVQSGTQSDRKIKSNMRQVVGIDTAYRVLSIATDGRVRVRSTTRATRFLREIDGKVVARYDSSQPSKNISSDEEIFALMHGLTFVVRFNPDGTIDEIEEKDKVVEQMLEKMEINVESRKHLRPLMTGALDNTAFKNLGNLFAAFPENEVGVGDSWPKTDIVTIDSNLIYDGTLTLAKRNAGRSTLNLKSAIKPDPNRADKAIVMAISGAQNGYFSVEEKSGWTNRAHLEQRWSARVKDAGIPIAANTKPNDKNGRMMYVKMTFDVGTLSAK